MTCFFLSPRPGCTWKKCDRDTGDLSRGRRSKLPLASWRDVRDIPTECFLRWVRYEEKGSISNYRRFRHIVPPAPEQRRNVIFYAEPLTELHRANRMKIYFELSHNPKVASTSTNSPEQIFILAGTSANQ